MRPFAFSRSFSVMLSLAGLVLANATAAASSPIQSTGKATASVANTCVVVSADSLAFGAYLPISGMAATGSGQIALRCTKGTAFTVSPTSGGAALRGTGGTLSYALYVDSAMSQPWGASTPARYVALDTSKTTQPPYTAGQLGVFFQNQISAAEFAANPSYASQPYGVYNTGGALLYYVNYLGQYQTQSQNTALRSTYANSFDFGMANASYVVNIDTAPTVPSGQTRFVLPTSTAKAGTVYNVPTGYSGTGTSLTGTTTSGLSRKAVAYYGKVPAGQDMPPGVYTDTVVFTVSF